MNAPAVPQIPERVDRALIAWAAWMHVRPADEMELGYPSRVKPWIGGGESQRGEDWSETQEQSVRVFICETMNALVESLPPAQQAAVGHIYCGDAYRFPRDNLFELMEAAAVTLMLGMNKRGVV